MNRNASLRTASSAGSFSMEALRHSSRNVAMFSVITNLRLQLRQAIRTTLTFPSRLLSTVCHDEVQCEARRCVDRTSVRRQPHRLGNARIELAWLVAWRPHHNCGSRSKLNLFNFEQLHVGKSTCSRFSKRKLANASSIASSSG